MPTQDLILGVKYRHDKSDTVMKIESASVEDLDDWITLVKPEDFAKRGFIQTWRGTCQEFRENWTEV